MSEVLESFPLTRRGPKSEKYKPFLDGRIHRVTNGIDFLASSLHSARNAFYGAASRYGKSLRIHIERTDPITLIVQATDKE